MAPMHAQLHVMSDNATKYEHIMSYSFRGLNNNTACFNTACVQLKIIFHKQ